MRPPPTHKTNTQVPPGKKPCFRIPVFSLPPPDTPPAAAPPPKIKTHTTNTQVPPGKKPFFRIPVFNYHGGYLSVNYSDNYFLLSQRHPEVPRLTQDQFDAMKVSESVCGGGRGV